MPTSPQKSPDRLGAFLGIGVGVLMAAYVAAGAIVPAKAPSIVSPARLTAAPFVASPAIPSRSAIGVTEVAASSREPMASVTASPVAKPTVAPSPTIKAAAPPIASAIPTAVATAPPTTLPPAASATPETLSVAHTDGLGVYIRRTTNLDDKVRVWIDGTPMVVVGPDRQVAGTVWKNVRDPDGNVGWVPSDYLITPSAATDGTTVETSSKLVFVGTPRYLPSNRGAQVVGLVKNTASNPLSGVLRARIVDANGQTVDNADGVVSDVQPGESRLYVLTGASAPASIAGIIPEVVMSRPGNAAPRIEISDVAVQPGTSGDNVVGRIHNADASAYAVALIAGFVDAQGNLAGTARGIVDALGAGETRAFSLPAPSGLAGYQRVLVQVATVSNLTVAVTRAAPAPSQMD